VQLLTMWDCGRVIGRAASVALPVRKHAGPAVLQFAAGAASMLE
jgi:hypothetical protein